MHQNRTGEGKGQLRLPREENVIVNPGRAEPWRYRRYSPCGPGTLTVESNRILGVRGAAKNGWSTSNRVLVHPGILGRGRLARGQKTDRPRSTYA